MKKILLCSVVGLISVLTGCATVVEQKPVVDNKLIVSQPFEYKLQQAAENIEKHLFLLYKLETKTPVEPTPVIVQNQNLHEDKKTIDELEALKGKYPEVAVNNIPSVPEVAPVVQQEVKVEEVIAPSVAPKKERAWEGAFLQKADIDWNDEVSGLVKNIATAVGYNFNVVGSSKETVRFTAEKATLGQIIDQLGTQIDGKADILVSHKDKKITLVFKSEEKKVVSKKAKK